MIYPNSEQIHETYEKTISVSGGGASGILKHGCIESIVDFIKNDDYYPTIEEKLTHLIYSVNKNHCYRDGNKRIAISLGALFLLLNGYVFLVPGFIKYMENISYHVASGAIDKLLLQDIITAIMLNETENEELKIKIFKAIS